jgi:copper chaperone NosL
MNAPRTSAYIPRSLGAAILLAALFAAGGCGKEQAPAQAIAIGPDTACALDGMLLADYPGPKAQIQYDNGEREFFCDTVEMFSMVLRPESARRVRAVYTQDMAKADWQAPRDNWIDATTAFYVEGSKLKGSMGPTFASFASREAAAAFAREHGGRVLGYAEVTPEMADLRGGAMQDERM